MLILSTYFSKKLYLLYSQCSLLINLFIGSILVKLNSLKTLDAQLWTKIQKVNKIIYFYFLTYYILKAKNKKVLAVSTYRFSSVQSLIHVWLFVTPWIAAHQVSLSITNSQILLKLISIESVMPSNHLIFCHPLLFLLQSFPASGSFQMSQFFSSGGQPIGASASASVLPMNIQGWFPLGLTTYMYINVKIYLQHKYTFVQCLTLHFHYTHTHTHTYIYIYIHTQTYMIKIRGIEFWKPLVW